MLLKREDDEMIWICAYAEENRRPSTVVQKRLSLRERVGHEGQQEVVVAEEQRHVIPVGEVPE